MGMSRILKNTHKSARRLHDAGYMDDVTMREFDALCLTPCPEFSAEDVVRIRRKARASQGVFAAFLNVGKTTVAAWEQGTKKPSGAASKLLDIVDRKGLDALV
jgi:putative transcriptional regulator